MVRGRWASSRSALLLDLSDLSGNVPGAGARRHTGVHLTGSTGCGVRPGRVPGGAFGWSSPKTWASRSIGDRKVERNGL